MKYIWVHTLLNLLTFYNIDVAQMSMHTFNALIFYMLLKKLFLQLSSAGLSIKFG